jgi:hypothetical protein
MPSDLAFGDRAALQRAFTTSLGFAPKLTSALTDIQLMIASIASECDNVSLQDALGDVLRLISDLGLFAIENAAQATGLAVNCRIASAPKPGTQKSESFLGGTQCERNEEHAKSTKRMLTATSAVAKRGRGNNDAPANDRKYMYSAYHSAHRSSARDRFSDDNDSQNVSSSSSSNSSSSSRGHGDRRRGGRGNRYGY